MKPTLGIVSLLLSDDYELSVGFQVEDDAAFSECVIYDGEAPRRGVLYLVDAPVGADPAWRGKLAICLSGYEYGDKVAAGEFHAIARERSAKKRMRAKEARFLDLANAVNRAIRRFDAWALELQQCCFETLDFREMLRMLEAEMGLVSTLVNRNLRYLASSDRFADFNPWFDKLDTSMDENMANQLMADEAFRNAISQRKPFFYHYLENGTDSYTACYNVASTGRYEARLLVQSTTGARVCGQLTLTSYVGDLIASVFARYIASVAGESPDPDFLHALIEIAMGSLVKDDSLRAVFSARGWDINDRFMVHVFSFIEPENESVTRRYYQDRISHLFEACAAFQHDGAIYCVRNLNLEGQSFGEAIQALVIFLRENLCHAGTSREFVDIRKLPAYMSEARCALRLGEASGTMQWHFRFEDFALSYIYDQARREFSWEELAHPAFEKLRLYDEQHNTELLETARYFMECKYNVSHTAERLHIHRSSMIARLDRIEDVAGIDWDSWDERVHLALSFGLAGFR